MTSSPIVSIVISTYNQQAYLNECLQVLVNDLSNIDAEIIVADDCSTDETRTIAEGFAFRYPGLIRLLDRQENLGPNLNYLRAHSAALGKYVAHIDGDDLAVSGKIQKQVSVMERDSRVTLVLHCAEYFTDSGDVLLITGIKNAALKEWSFSRSDLASWGPIAVHSSFMYRRDSIRLSEVFAPFMEWSIAMHCLSSGLGYFINERLVRYRYNPGGGAWTASANGRQNVYEIQWNNVREYFDLCPDLQHHLYAQVVANAVGILRGGAKLPQGMLRWLLREVRNFRFSQIVESLRTRIALMPRQP